MSLTEKQQNEVISHLGKIAGKLSTALCCIVVIADEDGTTFLHDIGLTVAKVGAVGILKHKMDIEIEENLKQEDWDS